MSWHLVFVALSSCRSLCIYEIFRWQLGRDGIWSMSIVLGGGREATIHCILWIEAFGHFPKHVPNVLGGGRRNDVSPFIPLHSESIFNFRTKFVWTHFQQNWLFSFRIMFLRAGHSSGGFPVLYGSITESILLNILVHPELILGIYWRCTECILSTCQLHTKYKLNTMYILDSIKQKTEY